MLGDAILQRDHSPAFPSRPGDGVRSSREIAFGDGLVNALYAAYEAAPEGFQDKYFALLSAGGSKHHKELLAPFGLDASDPAFWDKGLSMIEGFIDELEAMEA